MDKQVAEKTIYYNERTTTPQDIGLDTISSYASWTNVLATHQLIIKKQWLPDTAILTNDLIEENIEDAVDTWKKLPYSNRCSWQIFLEYVLPYKILNEYPQSWRKKVRKKLAPVAAGIRNDDHFAIRLLDTINGNVKEWFAFNVHQSPATWQELVAFKNGDCVAISCLMAFAGRSYGLPVAIDHCPVWANINGLNHYWNALLQPGKKCLPFMGGEGNPGAYNPFLLFETILPGANKSTFKKCAKVFRHVFTANNKSIRQWIQNDANIPYTLSDEHVIDVTKEYYSVTDITVNVPGYTNQKIVYLCVYNNGQWVPTAWDTVTTHHKAIFKDMANDRLYLPAFFSDGMVTPINHPFIADSAGTHFLEPAQKRKITVSIKYLASIEQEQVDLYSQVDELQWNNFAKKQQGLAAGKNRAVVKNGERYTLYYWDNDWKLFSNVSSEKGRAKFQQVPANCLYKIVAVGSQGRERVFTYRNGEQQWW